MRLYPDIWEQCRHDHDLLIPTKPSALDPPLFWGFSVRSTDHGLISNGSSNVSSKHSWESIVLLFAFTSVYGGVHAAAWNEYLPTSIERLLWRTTCVIIAASSALLVAFHWFTEEQWQVGSCFSDSLKSILIRTMFAIHVACWVLLLVEALIILRQLPITAYQSPHTVRYLPHT